MNDNNLMVAQSGGPTAVINQTLVGIIREAQKLVEEGKIALAIGKNGSSIKNVERTIGKKIKVYEYSSDPIKFIRNLIPQSKDVRTINDKNNVTVEVKVSRNDRGFIIGRGGEKIKIYKEIFRRIHNISDIQVK